MGKAGLPVKGGESVAALLPSIGKRRIQEEVKTAT